MDWGTMTQDLFGPNGKLRVLRSGLGAVSARYQPAGATEPLSGRLKEVTRSADDESRRNQIPGLDAAQQNLTADPESLESQGTLSGERADTTDKAGMHMTLEAGNV